MMKDSVSLRNFPKGAVEMSCEQYMMKLVSWSDPIHVPLRFGDRRLAQTRTLKVLERFMLGTSWQISHRQP
eukprot:5662928-Pyramimonas_sp.AAC.1